jgi:hypothetical protein
MSIDKNIWIVVKDTPHKYDPRAAEIDYIADVVDYTKFEKQLKQTNQKAFRARSYGEYFPNFEKARKICF